MTTKNLFKNLKLTKEEKAIEKALEKGEFISANNLKTTKKMFQEAAKNYLELAKSKRITIRVNQEDLIKVKAKAQRNKIPYQTLLNALIHQYSNGQLSISL